MTIYLNNYISNKTALRCDSDTSCYLSNNTIYIYLSRNATAHIFKRRYTSLKKVDEWTKILTSSCLTTHMTARACTNILSEIVQNIFSI